MGRIEKIISSNLDETQKLAYNFSKNLKAGSVVVFFAPLGAGKTTFIKNIVQNFSKKNIEVTSPTFVYMNIYDTETPIYHFDLYRIKNSSDFINFGFDEYFSNNGICLIEWAENILDILPK